MKDELEVSERFCLNEWPIDPNNPAGTQHQCYLDKGHDGECVCGRCAEGCSH